MRLYKINYSLEGKEGKLDEATHVFVEADSMSDALETLCAILEDDQHVITASRLATIEEEEYYHED